MDLKPLSVSVFPVTLPSTFPHAIQDDYLLHAQPRLQPLNCNRSSLPPKGYKIYLCYHFSIRTHYSSTFQQKLGFIMNLHDDPYLKTTSNVTFSPTQLPNVKILFKGGSSSRSRTGLSAEGDKGYTNTLYD